MIGDGILDGDHVVVATDPRPAPGAIAVVLIGEEATVKHIYYEYYEGSSIRLTSSCGGSRTDAISAMLL